MQQCISESLLLVIVGETASGKSALAMQLAGQFGGEILCADSRTVYKGMDIGTAKPSLADQCQVKHYGLDLIAPDERFTVADYKDYADKAIRQINIDGKIPIMVGGTGLYIDAVLYDYQFRPPADEEVRNELNTLSIQELQRRLRLRGIALPINSQNPRHLVRALETGGASSVHSELQENTLILGVQVEKEVLRKRIAHRVDGMFAAGLIREVQTASDRYGWDCTAMQSPGYRELRDYLQAAETIEQVKAAIVKNHLDLAKRQRTWFRRNKSIHWLTTEDKQSEAVDIVTTFLNK